MARFTEDKKHLLTIAEAINEAQGYLGNADYTDLNLREDTKESLAKTMQDIGVAARQLSDTFKDTYRDLDWDALVNLEYTTYNQNVEVETDMHPVYQMVKDDFSEIKDYVLSYIDEIQKTEEE